MLYGPECWSLTKTQPNRVEAAEMRMLRWTRGKTMLDIISNGVFFKSTPSCDYNQQDERMTIAMVWVCQEETTLAPIMRVESIIVDGLRRRGRPKLTWDDRL